MALDLAYHGTAARHHGIADPRPAPTLISAELTACIAEGSYLPPADLPLDTWLLHGRTLARRWATLLWLAADWARTGVDYYGPAAWSHLATVSGRDRDSLKRMVKVSRLFPPSRRRLGIPFSRHVAVYALPDTVADQLLERAEREGWTQSDMYRAVRVSRGQPTRPKPKQRGKLPAPAATTTTMEIVTPAVTDLRETAAPVRCSGCMLVVAYAVGTRAVTSTGPAAVQRIEGGRLVMNAQCTACESFTLVALGLLEIPAPAGLVAGAG